MNRLLVVLAGLVGSAGVAPASTADLFGEKVKDFGTSPRGPVLVHYFRFTNTTGRPITVGQPRVSCGCVSAAALHQQVAAGQTSAVVAYMDTRRIPTPNTVKSVTVYVPILAPVMEEVSLRVQTVCRDDLLMSPDTLAFGTVRKGQGGKASTRVTLTSDPSWQVTEAVSTGGYVKAEAKLVAREGTQVTYEVTSTLDPACPVGSWTADVWLKTTNPGVPTLRVPVSVTVAAPVAVSQEQVDLGSLTVGSPAQHKVIIQSTQPFKVLGVTGGDEQLSAKADSADAKAVHVIVLSAAPKAAGAFTRTVEIVTDNQEQPKIGLAVSAKVVTR